MKIKTYLPVFPGFYNTIFEHDESNEIDYINQERKEKNLNPIEFDQIEFDYQTQENNISIECCKFIESELSEFIRSIKFENLYSPKEYNFRNNSINCEIDIKVNEVKKYIKDNFDLWTQYLKEKYTSYSGFISSYSNDANDYDWNLTKALKHQHQAGSILEFICEVENITSERMFYCCKSVNLFEYNNWEQLMNENFCMECNEFESNCICINPTTMIAVIEKLYSIGASIFSNTGDSIAGFYNHSLFRVILKNGEVYFKDFNPLETINK